MRRLRSLVDLGLLGVALSLASAWFLLDGDSHLDGSQPDPFARLAAAPPERLALQKGSTRLVLRSRADAYEVEGNPTIPIERAAVDRLLAGLSSQRVLREVVKPTDLSQLGLAPPELTLEFGTGKSQVTIALGAHSSTNAAERYARLSQAGLSRVVVLDQARAATIDVAPESLTNRRLLDWVPSDIVELSLERGFSVVRLLQRDDGRFLFADDSGRRADRQQVETLLLELTQLELDKELASERFALAERDATFTVRMRASSERDLGNVTLLFGEGCPERPTHQRVTLKATTIRTGCVPTSVVQRLTSPEFDRHVFFLHADEVEGLSVERNDHSFVLERQGAAFVLRKPEERPVALDAGNGLLEALTSVVGSPAGLCSRELLASRHTVSLRSGIVGRAGPSSEKLKILLHEDGRASVCRDDGQALEISRISASALTPDAELLESPELLRLPYDCITQVRIDSPSGRQRLEQGDSLHLQLVEPRFPGDAARIQSLKERLAQLTAERRLPRSILPEPWRRPTTVVTFVAKLGEGQEQRHDLRLFATSDYGTVVTIDSSPSPFLLDATTLSLLDGLLVDRSLFRLTNEDRSFSLTNGKDTLTCERSGSGFVCPSHPFAADKVAAVVDALRELRAVAVEPAAAKPRVGSLKLRVYGATPGVPRFSLSFDASPVAPGSNRVAARADGSPLRMLYDLRELTPLRELLSDGSR